MRNPITKTRLVRPLSDSALFGLMGAVNEFIDCSCHILSFGQRWSQLEVVTIKKREGKKNYFLIQSNYFPRMRRTNNWTNPRRNGKYQIVRGSL